MSLARQPEARVPEYFRFDLNEGLHEDPLWEPRCHLHPGLEDVRIPLSIHNPIEILDQIFLVVLQRIAAQNGDARAERMPERSIWCAAGRFLDAIRCGGRSKLPRKALPTWRPTRRPDRRGTSRSGSRKVTISAAIRPGEASKRDCRYRVSYPERGRARRSPEFSAPWVPNPSGRSLRSRTGWNPFRQ